MRYWKLLEMHQHYRRHSANFTVVGSDSEDSTVSMNKDDFRKFGYAENKPAFIFLFHNNYSLRLEIRVDNGISEGQIRLGKHDMILLDRPGLVYLLRPHALLLEDYLLSEKMESAKRKLLVFHLLIHMEKQELMYDEILENYAIDARLYRMSRINQEELLQSINELVDEGYLSIETTILNPVIIPTIHIDKKSMVAEYIGVELESRNSGYDDEVNEFPEKGKALLKARQILFNKYLTMARKVLLFYIFIHQHLEEQSKGKEMCLKILDDIISDEPYKSFLSKSFTGKNSALWEDLEVMRDEFENELSSEEQVSLFMEFKKRLRWGLF